MDERAASSMVNISIDEQIRMLCAYQMDVWAETEAQLRLLRALHDEIVRLRTARAENRPGVAEDALRVIDHHVKNMRTRLDVAAEQLGQFAAELEEVSRRLSQRVPE